MSGDNKADLLNTTVDSNHGITDPSLTEIIVGSQFSGMLYCPNTPVFVKIIGVNESGHSVGNKDQPPSSTAHHHRRFRFSDSSWYLIKVTHGKYEWTMKKTIAEFGSMNSAVRNQLRVRVLLTLGRGKRVHVPYFPSKLDILFRGKMAERKGILEEYLQGVMACDILRTMDAVIRFFEISPVSFHERLGLTKWKEDYVHKLSSNRLLPLCCINKFCRQSRWLVIKDTYLLYLKRSVKTDQSVEEMDIEHFFQTGAFMNKVKRQWRFCKVLLMDQSFAFIRKVENNARNYYLKVYNTHGRLIFACQNEWHLQNWVDELATVLSTDGARDYVDDHRFGSFAPPRPNTHITVFIDGACYMEAVAKAIAQARYEIFITDWCMNPEIFLRRPVTSNTWRLDKLLQAKAEQGVCVCIMLYNGIEGIVPFSSVQTARYLHSLHPNIHVYFSPVRIMFWSHHEKMVSVDQSVVFMGGIDLCFGRWDTVDHRLQDVPKTNTVVKLETSSPISSSKYLDSGRKRVSLGTDAPRYKTPSQIKPTSKHRTSIWRLPKPFSGKNLTVQDRRAPRSSRAPLSQAESTEDSAVHRKFTVMFQRFGKKVHAIFSKADVEPRSAENYVELTEDADLKYLEAEWGSHRENSGAYNNFGFEGEEDEQLDETEKAEMVDLDQLCELGTRCTWIGQDYVNWMLAEPSPKLHSGADTVDRAQTPRIPWHDIGCVLSGRIAADFSRHFIQRWNAIRTSRIKTTAKGTAERAKRRRKPLLLPTYRCVPWTESELKTVLLDPRQSSVVQAQALRSCSNWSLGVPAGNTRRGTRNEFRQFIKGAPSTGSESSHATRVTEIGLESSIISAYVECILEAKRFIYIENQFFISFLTIPEDILDENIPQPHSTQSVVSIEDYDPYHLLPAGCETTVKNRLVDALYLRILRAHRENTPFRVYILLPLIPGFTGTYGDPKSYSQHKILYYLRLSLFVGDTALLPRLRKSEIDPDDYVSICGLRTYDEWPGGELKSEIIYIHSKFMVVDDCKMIVGSANINDRSLRGKRDSELAVLIERNQAGQHSPTEVCPFVRRVRRTLMAEHLGVLPTLQRGVQGEWPDELLDDPVCDEFFKTIWKATADKNADIFEQVFNAIPANRLKSFSDCRVHREQLPLSVTDPDTAKTMVKQIRGALVTFPGEFLEFEDLQSRDAAVENVAPAIIWT
ncbi:Phospholipase [Clonorchis sinensis]|uniref:Phospholipase n=1 Tax=Clonorchis sinensis TaxID=79923 RepID=A0A8T1MEL3_CLOSI|nr:Phospholipase [Clonorchis sinensis]